LNHVWYNLNEKYLEISHEMSKFQNKEKVLQAFKW
jgi:hypothetical protein